MKVAEYLWSLDPIGAILFIGGATLVILALDWTGGTYPWSDSHIIAPLVVGIVLLILFGLYGKAASDPWLSLANFWYRVERPN